MDVAGFLRRFPPFDAIDGDALARIASRVEIEFFTAGSPILHEEGVPARFLYVVRKGAVEVTEDGRTLDLLMEGETFGHLSLTTGEAPTATVRAHEDTICYLIPADAARKLLATESGLAFYGSIVRRRLEALSEFGPAPQPDPRAVDVASLIQREPVTEEPDSSIRDSVRRMSALGVSSLILRMGDRWGIVTDRDLRTRVLAAGASLDDPVLRVATVPAVVVRPDTSAADVSALMLERGFHHVPVVSTSGDLIGVVTDSDLMRLERYSPIAVKSAIERAGSVDAVLSAGRDLPRALLALVDARADPIDVGHAVSVAVDALTTRLIDLAMDELGPAPVAWAWLAFGSAARHEQALHSDQDHGLAYDPGGLPVESLDGYFAELAKRVTDGLEAVGFPRCRGDVMAENPALRKSVDAWLKAFDAWMDDPGVEGSVLTSIVFDYRRVAGPLDVDAAFDRAIRAAPSKPRFLRHLYRRALDQRPPTGFFRHFVVDGHGEHAGRLDVKHGGITIVTSLARAHAIAAGRTEKRTLQRLEAAAVAGTLDADASAGLREAFAALWDVRLHHQAAQARAGQPADDFVDPQTLGPLTRGTLKTSFRIVAAAQRLVATELGVALR